MAVTVTSQQVTLPSQVRMTTGTITFDSSYLANGEPVTPAQFGGGVDGVPLRLPDFVVFNSISKAGGAATTAAPVYAYDKAAGLVHIYAHTLSDNAGLAETQSTTNTTTAVAGFMAFWLSPASAIASA